MVQPASGLDPTRRNRIGRPAAHTEPRYHDPKSGLFTQEDPIGIAGGPNVYGFADGDPVTYSDPYGLEASGDNQQCRRRALACLAQAMRRYLAKRQRTERLEELRSNGRLRIDPGNFSESERFAAEEMALQGYQVRLRPPRPTRNARHGDSSDLVVNGQNWDVYTPESNIPDRVFQGILRKNEQAVGVVVDLSNTSVLRPIFAMSWRGFAVRPRTTSNPSFFVRRPE